MVTDLLDLDGLVLTQGVHTSRSDGVCFLEAAAWLAGEPHTDHPQCVSPVLGGFGRQLNDVLPDGKRQQLKPLLPRLLGTVGDGLDEQRGYLALDWLVRTYTPTWLDRAGLANEARALRELRPIADPSTERGASLVVQAGCERAVAAHSAASWDWNAGTTARTVPREVAAAVARDAGDAAWDGAAWALGRGEPLTVRFAVRSAAHASASTVAWNAWAAEDPVRDALQPTVDLLQDSAITLYASMITPQAA